VPFGSHLAGSVAELLGQAVTEMWVRSPKLRAKPLRPGCPPVWFQQVPETKAGKNRLHLDLYPTGRDDALPVNRRVEIVEAKVAELTGLG
jgi:Glyoxalase-like domain